MKAHGWVLSGAAAVFASAGLHGTPVTIGAAPAVLVQVQSEPQPALDGELPVVQVRRYKMAGRIRPFLFWMGRDDVGLGEIVWRKAEGAAAYEFLIGTDASRAPRGINRWGYILEVRRPSETRVLGVMTTSEEATLSEVTRQKDAGQQRGRFKAIDARIASGVSQSAVETIETDREFTIFDKAIVVRQVEDRMKTATPRSTVVPAGVRPGFLMAVAELMNDTVAARRQGAAVLRGLKGRRIAYVYGRKIFDLTLTGVEPIERSAAVRDHTSPLHADFEIRSRTTGERYTFELEYGTDGPLAGVPTLIRHQPRWWLQAVLTLDDRGTPASNGAVGTAPSGAPGTRR